MGSFILLIILFVKKWAKVGIFKRLFKGEILDQFGQFQVWLKAKNLNFPNQLLLISGDLLNSNKIAPKKVLLTNPNRGSINIGVLFYIATTLSNGVSTISETAHFST